MKRSLDEKRADLRARARNTVFPDTTRNMRRMDAALYSGDLTLNRAQRAGALIYGIFALTVGTLMVAGGVSMAGRLLRPHSTWLDLIFGVPGAALGLLFAIFGFRVTFNALWPEHRRHKGTRHT